MKSPSNSHDTREGWLRAATNELREYFKSCDYPLPENIRFAIGFPSTGRTGNRIGECWHSSTSADNHFEIFIRADQSEPGVVLGVLVHELVHIVVPIDAKHGKLYRAAAVKIGLTGQMVHAMPGILLQKRLDDLAETLGPLPHARLNIERGSSNRGPADRKKRSGSSYHKAECAAEGCGFFVRVLAVQVKNVGVPHCPRHGAMELEFPPEEDSEVAQDGEELREAAAC
jgi:hypothetical protein